MDLHTGTTVWQLLDGPNAAYSALAADEACDVVVIGGGLSGAQVAVHLARMGKSVIVLDRRQPLAGSSLACTALLQYELDQPL
ncbi:MAG TPA: FAD-dependent oxidoreductase, partial [Humisphaera sp.]